MIQKQLKSKMNYIQDYGLLELFKKNTNEIQFKILQKIKKEPYVHKGYNYGFNPNDYICNKCNFKLKMGETKRDVDTRIREQNGKHVFSIQTNFRFALEKLTHLFFDFVHIPNNNQDGTEMFLFNENEINGKKITKNVVHEYVGKIDDMLNDMYGHLVENETEENEKIQELEKSEELSEYDPITKIINLLINSTPVKNNLIEEIGKIEFFETKIDPNCEKDLEAKHRDDPNIIKTVNDCINKLLECYCVCLFAPMQSGKSVVMGRLITIFINMRNTFHKYNVDIKPENIYVILCMSDNSAKYQLKEKLGKITGMNYNNIIHIWDLQKLYKKTKNEKCLFIFDECQMNIGVNGMTHKFMKHNFIDDFECNPNHLRLFVSATPFDHAKYTNIPIIHHVPSENYYGLDQLIRNKKIRPAYNFKNDLNNVDVYLNEIHEDIKIKNNKGYIIVRLPVVRDPNIHTNIIKKFHKWCKLHEIPYKNIYYFESGLKTPIENILLPNPQELIFIFVKNSLRASKSLPNKKFIISAHDVPKNTASHVTLQSFIGRMCGYEYNDCVVYCDIAKMENGYEIINSNFSILPTRNSSNVYFKQQELNRIENQNLVDKMLKRLDSEHLKILKEKCSIFS